MAPWDAGQNVQAGGRLLVGKHVNSAFLGQPDLHAWLQNEGVCAVTICGMGTNQCCETSARVDVDGAVRAAARAQPSWAARTQPDRSTLLLALADRCAAELADLSGLEALDAGKPLVAARNNEIPDAIDAIRFVAGAARSLSAQGSGRFLEGATSLFLREPVGVIAAITPWNYPLLIAAVKIAQAGAVGNTVVVKPSELTPLSTVRLVELANEILPPGVVNLVLGTGSVAGEALVRHPLVGQVSFTGSVVAGLALAGLQPTGSPRRYLSWAETRPSSFATTQTSTARSRRSRLPASTTPDRSAWPRRASLFAPTALTTSSRG